jgi:hypothetical protein
MTSAAKIAGVVLLFGAVTVAMTYPLILHMGTSVRDAGDPLLNAWILSWDARQISRLDLRHFADANIFFPEQRTLMYSEVLLTQALVAFPFLRLLGNPILAYNIVLVLAILSSALGMFALAWRLTKSVGGGIIAGLVFAFNPFMFAHLSQVQVLSACGLPLAFLFLHRFFDQNRFRDLIFFSLCFVLQSLANIYYALYLAVFSALFVAWHALAAKKWTEARFWLLLILAAALISAALAPVFIQYARVQKEMGFVRNTDVHAELKSSLATSRINRIYGAWSEKFQIPEGELFPGVVAASLGLAGFLSSRPKRGRRARKAGRPEGMARLKAALGAYHLSAVLAVASGLVFLWIVLLGGFDVSWGVLKFHGHSMRNPLWVLLLALCARFWLGRFLFESERRPWSVDGRNVVFYGSVFALAYLFTFGLRGPYFFLYRYVPGFRGVRVASRFHIFVMAALAVLAAYGVRNLLKRRSLRTTTLVTALFFLVIAAEYWSVPVPLLSYPVKEGIPEVYRWLAGVPGDFAVVELPFPDYEQGLEYFECVRMYYSTYHWKRLVNGYSGYFPPRYYTLCRLWKSDPLGDVLNEMKRLGVRYAILHFGEMESAKAERVRAELAGLAGRYPVGWTFGPDVVVEVGAPSGPGVPAFDFSGPEGRSFNR